MWSRVRFDVGWSDLLFGVARSLWLGDRNAAQERLERLWSADGDSIACHSVRSGFDLLLTALDLPEGSEILFSALNVKGMIEIARWHGLVPVPVDLEIGTMGPDLEALERAISPASCAIVVAHLFGARLDLAPVLAIAQRRGLLVIEDCAQAFAGLAYTGHPDCDASLFSFGPLKTATALGGALARVRDREVLRRMRVEQSRHPVQSRGDYLVRVVKFAGFKMLTWRWVLGLVVGAFRAFGRDYEDAIADTVRGVARLDTPERLRRLPAASQLAMLERRLLRFRPEMLERRCRAAKRLRRAIGSAAVVPGEDAARHDHWVFPVLIDEPRRVIAALRAQGFDASDLPRSRSVAAPPDRPKLEPVVAKKVLSQLVVLPCYAGMPASELERQASLLRRAVAAQCGTACQEPGASAPD